MNAPILLPIEKKCWRCGRLLPASHFGKDIHHRHGLNTTCKECRRSAVRNWRLTHPEKAAWKSAREAAIRKHGKEGVTPELIAGMAARLAAERAERQRNKAMAARSAPRATPPGTFNIQTLTEACGISTGLLRKHRLLNTAGIADAAFRLPQEGLNPLLLFDARKAADFIAMMRRTRVG